MPSRETVMDLVRHVEDGRVLEAMERFYADGVEMRENLGAPVVGRAANLERERAFFGGITVNEQRAAAVLVDGDRAVINWILDFTTADGQRVRMDQLALQTWEGDRIVRERFVYDPGTLAAAA